MASNIEKYDIYKSLKTNLKKAIQSEFYYEAIFLEYAIIEDRCKSVLKHAGIKYTDSKDFELKLSAKLNKLRSNSAFTNTFVRKRLPLDFIDDIETWKRDRDKHIHNLANIPYNPESLKEIVEHGQDIVRRLENAVKSVNNFNSKRG